VAPSVREQLTQIEREYQAKQEDIRTRYSARLSHHGTRIARLKALWQAYMEETKRLREAYHEAWRQWHAVMREARKHEHAARQHREKE
jgi:hypothetical protein